MELDTWTSNTRDQVSEYRKQQQGAKPINLPVFFNMHLTLKAILKLILKLAICKALNSDHF